jgi:ESF2/ABP1 family protein
MASKYNAFLEASGSEESENDRGYDSEAAEQSKGRKSIHNSERAPKRRKVSDAEYVSDADDGFPAINGVASIPTSHSPSSSIAIEVRTSATDKLPNTTTTSPTITTNSHEPTATSRPKETSKKTTKPGVIYLSSLPPYLRPSALRNLLTQRGFDPVTRLFLAPASKPTRGSKSKSTSTKSSKRQLYTEGWIEFASKSTAKRCAETLNAAPVGGKKGGFYRDDVWNMKYLRGMRWEELMAGVREERREEEGRRDEERLVLARETKRFVEGVERGRKMKGIEGSRAKRKKDEEEGGEGPKAEEAGEIKRTWRQFEVKGNGRENPEKSAAARDEHVDFDVKSVLGKIF